MFRALTVLFGQVVYKNKEIVKVCVVVNATTYAESVQQISDVCNEMDGETDLQKIPYSFVCEI